MSGKELVRRLEHDRWTINRIRGSHYIMYKKGFKPQTVPVHGNKEIHKGTLKRILKNTNLI